jgi:hypothetical protein
VVADADAMLDGFERYLDLGGAPTDSRNRIRAALDDAIRERAGSDGIARLANPAVVASARRL